MTIYDIFEQYGENKFREIEHEAIKKIDVKSNYIIATGGGAFTFERNYNILNQSRVNSLVRCELKKL